MRLKMWTTLRAGHWICLLTLAGVMLFTGSTVEAMVGESCCYEAEVYIGEAIEVCIKQKPTRNCNSSNFAVRVQSGKWYCIKSDSPWMNRQIQKGKVSCSEEFFLQK